MMVHKYAFSAILCIGNQNGCTVCRIQLMVQEKALTPKMDITFLQWNGTLWAMGSGGPFSRQLTLGRRKLNPQQRHGVG